MSRTTLVILLGSLCALSAAQATTYVRVEKDGTKTYSDRPIPGGQPIDLQPAQGYSAPSASAVDPGLPREQQLVQKVDEFKYTSCAISPENDLTFQSPEYVSISVSTSPALRAADLVTMTLDGQPVGGPNVSNYTLSPAYRGTHTVNVKVKNPEGQVLCNATSVFHVMRPGVNSPARAPQARPRN